MEHADWRLLPEKSLSSAPRLIQVVTTNGDLLGEFEFDPKFGKMTFDLKGDDRELVKTVVLRILSNWGNEAWTCLYRIQVHGHEN